MSRYGYITVLLCCYHYIMSMVGKTMHMSLKWQTSYVAFIFESWTVSSDIGFVFGLLLTCLVAFLTISLPFFKTKILSRLKTQQDRVFEMEASADEPDRPSTLAQEAMQFAYVLVYAVLHVSTMMLIMTFNGYVVLSIILGYSVGYALVGLKNELIAVLDADNKSTIMSYYSMTLTWDTSTKFIFPELLSTSQGYFALGCCLSALLAIFAISLHHLPHVFAKCLPKKLMSASLLTEEVGPEQEIELTQKIPGTRQRAETTSSIGNKLFRVACAVVYAFVHTVVMLLVMTMNGYVILSVTCGFVVGYALGEWKRKVTLVKKKKCHDQACSKPDSE